MSASLQFGLDTFGDVTVDADGRRRSHAQVIRDVIAEGEAAEAAGVDVFSVGEHHRADFAVSAPEVVLGALAGRTARIRLGSAVTVLSSDDPVRVFQRFSTLNAASGGRAEAILGRGSFTESFPLFGYRMEDYERLFEEKLDLYAALLREEKVSWRGSVRAPLSGQAVYPTVEDGPLATWVGVGGSPQSVVRAVRHDLPLMLAIIGGDPRRFQPYVDLYGRACAELGRPVRGIGVHSPGHVAETDQLARERLWPSYKIMHDQIGSTRGWPPLVRADFEREADGGSLYVGSPETVAKKIAATVSALGLTRFSLKYSAGPLAHDHLLDGIGLYGREVIPRVRAILGEQGAVERVKEAAA